MTRPEIAIVGGGPAGLMAAEIAAGAGAGVTVYERMPSPGRKFLIAGRGGLNLTHSEAYGRFLTRYGNAAPQLREALDAFPPDALRAWADGLGAATFVGSSGRVFPRSWKASPLLRAWLRRLGEAGVRLAPRHRWTGFGPDGAVLVEDPGGALALRPDAAILALGGASWPRLGSDGTWQPILREAGIPVRPLVAANCGLLIAWSAHLRERHAGTPLKRIALALGDRVVRGEAILTETGLEGGAVYAVSGAIRDALPDGPVTLRLDLRPDLTGRELAEALSGPRGKTSLSTFLRKAAGLSPAAISLLREPGADAVPGNAAALAARIKGLPLTVVGTAPIERAISSAGGIRFEALDEAWMLRARPGLFAAGEMLDWEAPTGGYLLQASLATGAAAARGALAWTARDGVGERHRSPCGAPITM